MRPAGTLVIATSAALAPALRRAAHRFEAAHAGVHVLILGQGSDVAMARLYTGQADAAVIGRDASDNEIKAYAWIYGHAPQAEALGAGSRATPGLSPALAVIVAAMAGSPALAMHRHHHAAQAKPAHGKAHHGKAHHDKGHHGKAKPAHTKPAHTKAGHKAGAHGHHATARQRHAEAAAHQAADKPHGTRHHGHQGAGVARHHGAAAARHGKHAASEAGKPHTHKTHAGKAHAGKVHAGKAHAGKAQAHAHAHKGHAHKAHTGKAAKAVGGRHHAAGAAHRHHAGHAASHRHGAAAPQYRTPHYEAPADSGSGFNASFKDLRPNGQ